MPKITFDRLDLNLVSSLKKSEGNAKSTRPFNILILGDFSGHALQGFMRSSPELLKQKIINIDRDNFNQVIAKLNVEIQMPLTHDHSLAFSFKSLEDFHPDTLFAHQDIFKPLRDLRRKAQEDPGLFKTAAVGPGITAPDHKGSVQTNQTGLLDQIIGSTADSSFETGPNPSRDPALRAFLQQAVTPHIVPKTGPQQAEFLAGIDQSAEEIMRAILHYPLFQTLESIWRGLAFLVHGLETGPDLKINILDISKADLLADLAIEQDIAHTGLCKLIVENSVETPGAEPWALLTGLYTFSPQYQDIILLDRLAELGQKAGAPFISAGHDTWLGCASLAAAPDPREWNISLNPESARAWDQFRKKPAAPYLGLTLPRFLLRLPYGKETSPLESFSFEEMTPLPEHAHYLWGNPGLACAYLLGKSFLNDGWNFKTNPFKEIRGLPLHSYKKNNETFNQPCAEILLTERTAEEIMTRGFMPLLSFRDQDKIRLPRFQSAAEPLQPLAGKG